MTLKDIKNKTFYTKDLDGTISKWYFFSGYEDCFQVAAIRNATLSAYTRLYCLNDIDEKIFLSKKAAMSAEPMLYKKSL